MQMFDESDFDYSANGFFEYQKDGINFAEMNVKKDGEISKGKYKIISCHNLFEFGQNIKNVTKYSKKCIKELIFSLKIKKNAKILIVGLGNDEILSDSFGSVVCKKILPSMQYFEKNFNYKVYCICPSVKANTGIATVEIVRGVATEIKADLVVLIDSLITKKYKRLGHSFQFSNVGITPGGGVGENGKICFETIGVKCISIGVPFMLDLKRVTENQNVIVSPKDVKVLVFQCAQILADAINSITNNFSKSEIRELLIGV